MTNLGRRHGINRATFYTDPKRLKALEDENERFKRLSAEVLLEQAALKDLLSRKWERPPPVAKGVAILVESHKVGERCAVIGADRTAVR